MEVRGAGGWRAVGPVLRRIGCAACLLAVIPSGPADARTAAQDSTFDCLVSDSLRTVLDRIGRRVGGEIGIAAIHIESGARVSVNGERRFPMASVSKIPMAIEFLRRVDLGEVRLEDTLVLPITGFRAGHSPLASWSGGRPVTVTVDSLFRLMIEVSDNTATDVILRMAGGPTEVTRRLRELGIEDIDVDRSEARTFADLVGISDTVPESELYRYAHFRKRDALPAEIRQEARIRYGGDPRDTATPEATAWLLVELWNGAGLSTESRDRLLEAMAESRSGPRRLKGLLPRGTTVAHKTGTMAAAVNDVGIITLAGNAGHVAAVVYVNTLYRTTWRRERTIAQASRAVFDYFSTYASTHRADSTAGSCGPTTPILMTPAGR